MVEGCAGGGVKVDFLGGCGGVTADDGMARHMCRTLDEVCRGVPTEPGSGGDAASLIFKVFIPIHLFFHLDTETQLQ